MTAKDLKKKYLDFFVKKGHKIIPNVSLIPENDPTALFISAGMHPLVPYLLGESHPLGKRLCSVQRCLRTDDIDSVGDSFHHTFFEMLGNWSLGDYWKKEAIEWSYEFLTKELGLNPNRLYISCFGGDKDAPKDEESAKIWQKVGISKEKIYFYGKKENWWGPAGKTGPCGPDTEMFYDATGKPCGPKCHPNDNCGRFFEIWNDVFMQYNKIAEGKYKPLKQKNVDTGMGVERTLTVLQGRSDDYETELFQPIVKSIVSAYSQIVDEKGILEAKNYSLPLHEKKDENALRARYVKSVRIIADHVKAGTFLIAEGIIPYSRDERGAVLRRLLEGAIEEGRKIGVSGNFLSSVGNAVIDIYKETYPELAENKDKIARELSFVEQRVLEIINNPPKSARIVSDLNNINEKDLLIDMNRYLNKYFTKRYTSEDFLSRYSLTSLPSVAAGTIAFDAKTTYGYPVTEVKETVQRSLGEAFKPEEFEKVLDIFTKEHQKKSRLGGERLFRGGLADHSEEVTKLHTATHLLNAALRQVLGSHIEQKGSNITAERLRFDFPNPRKLTEEELKNTEGLVNQKIKENLPVKMEMMAFEKAKKMGAVAVFAERYGEKVKVYSIGDYSKEVCGGPHVDFTGKLGKFKIIKEESAGAGIRRIYAKLE